MRRWALNRLIMKKFFKLGMCLLPLLLMLGCNEVDKALEKQAEAANNVCPMQVDEITTLERVEYANKSFLYHYSLTPSETADYLMDEVSDDVLKTNLLNSLQNNMSSEMEKFKQLCKAAECVVVYRYQLGDRQRDITISAYEW